MRWSQSFIYVLLLASLLGCSKQKRSAVSRKAVTPSAALVKASPHKRQTKTGPVSSSNTPQTKAQKPPQERPKAKQKKRPDTACLKALAKEGVRFRRWRNPRHRPKKHPRLICSVDKGVKLYSPVHGVDWINGANVRVPMFMRCELALAVSRLSKYLRWKKIARVIHYGAYNCRVAKNDQGATHKISQHGLGRAIDIAGFVDESGTEYSLLKHWDRRTTWINKARQLGCWSRRFRSARARFLYKVACDMWTYHFFGVVLTPNFNRSHRDHYHLALGGPSVSDPSRQGELDGWLSRLWQEKLLARAKAKEKAKENLLSQASQDDSKNNADNADNADDDAD